MLYARFPGASSQLADLALIVVHRLALTLMLATMSFITTGHSQLQLQLSNPSRQAHLGMTAAAQDHNTLAWAGRVQPLHPIPHLNSDKDADVLVRFGVRRRCHGQSIANVWQNEAHCIGWRKGHVSLVMQLIVTCCPIVQASTTFWRLCSARECGRCVGLLAHTGGALQRERMRSLRGGWRSVSS